MSHTIGFSVLFLGAIWDLYTTEVPDLLGITGVLAGVGLHGYLSFSTGSLDPLLWSIGVGGLFSLYGWGMYFAGMWGGADAFAMSVLGFAAPYGLSGPGAVHAVNLFLNVMIAGFVYTLLFAFYRLFQKRSVLEKVYGRLRMDERRMSIEILASGIFSGLLLIYGFPGFNFFVFLVFLVFLYRFLRVLEDEMVEKVHVGDLQGGEVLARNGDVDRVKNKNLVGRSLEFFDHLLPGGKRFLKPLERKFGYSEVVGVREDEIRRLKNQGIDEVSVKHGVRFIPVFPVALLITDVMGGGLAWILMLS